MPISVTLRARAADGDPDGLLRAADTFAETLEALTGTTPVVTISATEPTYAATLDVPGDSPVGAVTAATRWFTEAAAQAGLPAWPIVEVHARTYDELDRHLDEPLVPEVMSTRDLADLLNVAPDELDTLDLPEPVAHTADGPLWLASAARAWASART